MKTTASLLHTQPALARSSQGTESIWHEFWKPREHPNARTVCVRVSLTKAEQDGAQFEAETGSGHHFLLYETSYGTGPRPIDLVAAALAGCAAFDVISMLRAKHQPIAAYEVRVETEQAERSPHAIVAVRIHHVFAGKGIDPAVVSEAIQMSTEKGNTIETMLKNTASIMTTFEIVEKSGA